jgi:hypothetical protein
VDLVCWISVWMSSQAAIWVTCGLAGALIGWLAACGAARLRPQYAGTGSMQGARTFRADEVRARNE